MSRFLAEPLIIKPVTRPALSRLKSTEALDQGTFPVKITIDCPVCNSRNAFVTEKTETLSCDDCGFLLASNSQVPTDRCLFCESRSFYYSSPLGVSLLGRDIVCYVCGAHYRKARIDDPEPRFSEESFERAQQSNKAREFKARASHWH